MGWIMARLIRFGVSIEEDLIKRFDASIKNKKYSNRSEAIRDLIRSSLIEEEWEKDGEVSGGIIIVYNHRKRELVNKLLDIQHDFHDVIISSQHVHLEHNNCFEIIVVKGYAKEIKELTNKLKTEKGVKHCSIAKTTAVTGIM